MRALFSAICCFFLFQAISAQNSPDCRTAIPVCADEPILGTTDGSGDIDDFDPEIMEVHVDVSPFNAKQGTSKFSDMLKGYVNGYGFDCKIKPNAWASQSVADKHSK